MAATTDKTNKTNELFQAVFYVENHIDAYLAAKKVLIALTTGEIRLESRHCRRICLQLGEVSDRETDEAQSARYLTLAAIFGEIAMGFEKKEASANAEMMENYEVSRKL